MSFGNPTFVRLVVGRASRLPLNGLRSQARRLCAPLFRAKMTVLDETPAQHIAPPLETQPPLAVTKKNTDRTFFLFFQKSKSFKKNPSVQFSLKREKTRKTVPQAIPQVFFIAKSRIKTRVLCKTRLQIFCPIGHKICKRVY
jgi:hypothetical protein